MSFASFLASPSDDVQLDTQLYTMIELEGNRYRAFFAKLSGKLYARLKEQQLLRDHDHMNEMEFAMGMHFIVCMTKRNLVKIPPKFPSYLFPTLDLTPERRPSFGFPSPGDHSDTSKASMLSRVDQSEARALQSLHACVERIADQVDGLGFPVPSSARSLESLDDLRNLLQKHVHAAKQEIQSMQIDAQMRSVASEVAQGEGHHEDPMKVASSLTQELMALQHLSAQLMAKKADVVGRLVAVKSGGSAAGSIIQQSSSQGFAGGLESNNHTFALSKGALTVGELGTASASTTPPKNVEPSLMQSQNSASSGGWGTFGAAKSQDPPPPASNDPFAFGSAAPAGGATDATGVKKSESTPAPENDFAWGSFQ
ncbi:hypothetical protein JG688_00012066 [Phytophthora aleatoria]|uniref:EH domain-containing protein n=1 Tax=Phytophthora aleatoria TaxID=2496075 RepID=A0A8J5J368_9STRA|nr:hypothetical protein JG688_00012066 [Phytophthora aleatoria]